MLGIGVLQDVADSVLVPYALRMSKKQKSEKSQMSLSNIGHRRRYVCDRNCGLFLKNNKKGSPFTKQTD